MTRWRRTNPAASRLFTQTMRERWLRKMIAADPGVGIVAVEGPATGGATGLSKERLAAYRTKLIAAGATSVASGGDRLARGEVRFETPRPAGWPEGSRASIVFSESTGLQRVDSIAGRLSKAGGIRVARELDIAWYLVGEN